MLSESKTVSRTTSTIKVRPSEHWEAARKAVFGAMKINVDGRSRKLTRFDVFQERLKQSALKGDTDAIGRRNRLRRHLERSRILDAAPEVSAGRQLVLDSMAQQQNMAKIAAGYFSLAHAMIDKVLESRDPAAFAALTSSDRHNPYEIDFAIGRKCLAAAERSVAKQGNSAQGRGYANPPEASRWRKNQSGNPQGRRKRVDDGWATFRAGLSDYVPVRVNGHTKKLVSDEVITIQLFDSACKGNRNARRLVCDLLVELDSRHLLTPPAPRRRRKKLSPEEHHAISGESRIVLDIVLLNIMRDRENDFAKVFGPNPNFQSDIDRELAVAVEHLKQAAANQERRHGQE